MTFSRQMLQDKLATYPFTESYEQIRFVEGFFDHTLTAELAHELKLSPPAIVTIDVDYYSSTRTVLEWCADVLASGALIYFDDIWAFHGHPDYGQLRAIREFNASHRGHLTPFDTFGEAGKAFVFARRALEY